MVSNSEKSAIFTSRCAEHTVIGRSSFIFVQWKVYVYLQNFKAVHIKQLFLIQQYIGFFSVNRWFLFLLQIAGIFPANFLSLEINWYINGNFAVSVLIWNCWQIFQAFWFFNVVRWSGGYSVGDPDQKIDGSNPHDNKLIFHISLLS